MHLKKYIFYDSSEMTDGMEIGGSVTIFVRTFGPKLSVIWVPHVYLLKRTKTIKERTKREANEVLTGNYT